MYRKNTAGQFLCVQLILTATGAVGTGLTPAARRCLDGTFGAGGGSFTEDGTTGSYKYALAQADTNANDVSIIVTATGCIPVCVNFITTAADPSDSVRFGLTGLANAVPGATGGLFIAGTNAATTVTTALTTTFTGNLTGSVASVTGNVGGNVVGSVATVTDLTAAQAEPGQAAPAANASVVTKIAYVYKAWRNKATQTATTYSLFNDDAATVDQKATVSDDATTFTRGEVSTGP